MDENRGHPSPMSIGASAILGMTLARLHAITGSRWRRTVRIAGKNILGFGKMARRRRRLANAPL
jgi:hypothetical protein